MNTYDPMDRITYRHMDQQPGVHSAPTPSSPTVDRLPSGYANSSPRTYLARTRRLVPTASGRVAHVIAT